MVDWPRAVAVVPVVALAVVPRAGVAIDAVAAAGWVEGLSPPSLGNMLDAAAGVVVAAAVVEAGVPEVAAAVDLAPPNVGNSEPPAGTAAVDDGVVEDVAPPRLGKKAFCGVAVDAAVVDGAAEGVPPRENADLGASPLAAEVAPRVKVGLGAASPLAEGVAPRENADLGASALAAGFAPRENVGFGVVSPPVVVVAAPNSGLGAGAALAPGVLDSAGLLTLPNRLPPPDGGAGAKPRGFELAGVAPAPKRLPDGCGCEVVGVVEERAAVDDGVVEVPAFSPPKSEGALAPGGGPAGVVEVFPNKRVLAGAGVADEAPPPKKLPEGFAAPPLPNMPLLAGCAGVVEPVFWFEPKEKPEDAPGVPAVVAPALPKTEGLCAPEEAVPKSEGEALPLVAEAPTFPKRPEPPDPVLELV